MDAEWSSISAQLHGSFLDRQVQRTNRNLFLVSLLLIIGVAACGFAQRRYLYNFFAGPFDVDGNSLKSIQYPDDQFRYFIKIRGEDSTDTGLQEVEQETESGSVQRETVKANYSLMFVGKRVLVVKSSPNEKGPVFQGALCELPTDLRNQIVRPLLKEYPNANDAFLPRMLDATGFRSDGYIALAICIPTILLAVWLHRLRCFFVRYSCQYFATVGNGTSGKRHEIW